MSDFDLFRTTEEHEELREAVRSVAEDKIAPHAAEVDERSAFPQDALDALVATDFHAPHIAEEYDGVGADALATCIVIEEVARVCASSSLIPAVNKLGTMPLILGASEEVKRRYLPEVASGEAMFSYGLSEREAGSDTASMRTQAVADGDGWILNGQKSWITNAGVSKYYTVLAVTDPEGARGRNVSAFVLHADDEGFTLGEPERKLGIKGSPTRELFFDNVRVPGDRIVGAPGEGLKIALRTLDHTRVTIGAQAVGIAQGALDQAVAYVKERKQFGRHIADFQGVQFMLADMAMKLETARQMVYVAAAKSERGDDDLPFYGAAAKCFASDAAMEITTDAVQLLGGAGYVKDFPLERMMRDAKITQIYEGTNQIQRMVMARQLLK
ncbi:MULTISPECIES: acyl-CoA dehydrogenase family protein [Nocardiopsis]|uniref:Probable acyl-CoA dehydrogenase fadE25 n=1 Tax=Nocardiopsis dassonvillei (strain ATCC 23218 / DSM 43111 / CIP 107115 / JCM 7437 / KCTC 9190 / NBRC 14626 / NCTC 10488 / NRRL B-5397 / IMRU 509) TaxID=446468 RepID=D7AX32_NOCDD|nr:MULTISPECIES: acyl-CoA dehydrogenase family protein [Nocardiopsis]ADH69802.1 acyl-CoA dehydrogenase domain protein [Nocardiopsis dassonvillei subsp. dassonvillei DSM 43111]APC37801.1 acyl-CoA dehydrogenase [Nocardiopsis dassonvillei]NKY80186.1 acyl-CoA dehydrogenase [Nocardiopsis dassonvillei]VEI90314.1 Acyl-CoA dehydrogenase, short-chain specific [Nocardiopsis dassonvillei]